MRILLVLAALLLAGCASGPSTGSRSQGNFDTVEAAKTRISLGLTYLKNGNYRQAKVNLDKAIEFAPRLADAQYSMAYYYQVVGENGLAEQAYQMAMGLAPRNADIANSYGAFLCQQGKYDQAKDYFLKAVNSSSYASTAESYENLALCSQSQGQIADGIEYLRLALNHQPSRAKSLLLLTQLLASESQWQEAKAVLARYERVARVTPESLWLTIKIEQALGNHARAQGYGDMLIRMYPEHPNTADYISKRAKPAQSKPTIVATPPPPPPAAVEEPVVEDVENAAEVPNNLEEVAEEVVEQAAEPELVVAEPEPVVTEPEPVVAESEPVATEPEPVATQPEPAVAEPVVSEVSVPETEVSEPEPEINTEELPELAQDNETFHIVQRNENLYRISLRYNIKMQRLIDWNDLEDASSIYFGMKLYIVDPQTIE